MPSDLNYGMEQNLKVTVEEKLGTVQGSAIDISGIKHQNSTG